MKALKNVLYKITILTIYATFLYFVQQFLNENMLSTFIQFYVQIHQYHSFLKQFEISFKKN